MSNTVSFYEKKFAEARSKFQEQKNVRSGTSGNVLDGMVVRSMPASVPAQMNPDIMAALTILKEYHGKSTAHHKKEARGLLGVASVISSKGDALKQAINSNGNIRGLFFLASAQTLNLSSDPEKWSEEEVNRIGDECRKHFNSPSPEIQKRIIGIMVNGLLTKATLAKHKSDFASLSFVLVKKLKLQVSPEAMENIIQGANFSKGFLYCGSAKSIRAEELAILVQQKQKPEVNSNFEMKSRV